MCLALCAFVAVMAVQAPRVPGPLPIGWAEIFFVLAAAAFLVRSVRRRELPLPRASVAAAGYVACVALSAAVHRSGWLVALGALELAAVMTMTASASRAERIAILRAWIAAAVIWCLVGDTTAVLAVHGVSVDPLFVGSGELAMATRPAGLCRMNMLAEVLLVPLLVLVGDEHIAGRWRWPLVALFGATLAATVTRAILAFGVGLVAIAVRRRRVSRPRAAIAVAALALLAVASMRLDIHGDGTSVHMTTRPGIRWRIAASALAHAASSPCVGIGPAQHAAVAAWPAPQDFAYEWDAHSTLLDVAATRGVPALLFWLATVVLVVRAARRRRDPMGDRLQGALFAALMAILFNALTLDIEDARDAWVLFGLCIAERD